MKSFFRYYIRNMCIVLLILLFLLSFTSCTKRVNPQPAGGSKADGMVNLSYRIHKWKKAKVDTNEAKQKAIKRCKAWGYESATHFGTTKNCVQYDMYGSCTFYRVMIKYQCVE